MNRQRSSVFYVTKMWVTEYFAGFKDIEDVVLRQTCV